MTIENINAEVLRVSMRHAESDPKVDKDEDRKAFKFTNQQVTCSVPIKKYSELHKMNKEEMYHL